MKLNGYGAAVIQRLVKTSIKKNLYWEEKDKIIEEAFNGIKTVRKSKRVRVYGLDSNKEIRNRLIEILRERVQYHKDKFIAPILHQEMRSMVVKKNGKVEHSDNSHDDQVFSYLMALYVWYEGKNLAERFHIMKNTIRTDTDEELDEIELEDSIEASEKVNLESTVYEPDSDIAQALEFIEQNSKFITSADLRKEQYQITSNRRDLILSMDEKARESYTRDTGVDQSTYAIPQAMTYVMLPDVLFSNEFDLEEEDEQRRNSVLAGNMAQWWDKV